MATLWFSFLVSFFGSLPAFSQDSLHEIEQTYLKRCGGISYNKCDSEDDLSQLSLFEAARNLALRANKPLLIFWGADWCPPCRAIVRDFQENPDLLRQLEQKYVAVHITGGLKSSRKLTTNLELNIIGYPSATIYNPGIKKVQNTFSPTDFKTLREMVNWLTQDPQVSPDRDVLVRYGEVRPQLLAKPIVKFGNFGSSTFTPSTHLADRKKEEFLRLARKGMLYFHGFHWVNTIRALNSALRLEKNPVLIALRGLAQAKIETRYVEPITVLEVAAATDEIREFTKDEDDIQFVETASVIVRSRSREFCQTSKGDMGESEIARDALKKRFFLKPDYLALFGYWSSSIVSVGLALDLEPNNVGAHHYLIHLNESLGNIQEALRHGEAYAKAAPDSPHAHHMYGHILPQVGRWQEATVQFQEAHRLHEQEFNSEGIFKEEDWHYSHNLDLYVATLLHQERLDVARTVIENECRDKRDLGSCLVVTEVRMALGEFDKAERVFLFLPKIYANSPNFVAYRILFALGQKKRVEADRLITSLKGTGDYSEGYPSIQLVQFLEEVLFKKGDFQDLKKKFVNQFRQPGFDSWSNGSLFIQTAAKVFEIYERLDLAQ